MIYYPKNKQSLLDVALQHHGNLESLFAVMSANGFKTINPDMSSGVIIEPNDKSRNVQFLRQIGTIPSHKPTLAEYDFDPLDFAVNNSDFI